MKHNPIIAVLSLCTLVSCGSPSTKNISVKKYIDIDSLSVCETMNELPFHVKFIKLATSSDCILGDIKKIMADGTNIFIEDFRERVFRFDAEGHFLNKIGVKGGSRGEYVSLFDFYLDKENQMAYLMDLAKGKLLRYDYDGKFVSSQDVAPGLLPSAVGVTSVNENELISTD